MENYRKYPNNFLNEVIYRIEYPYISKLGNIDTESANEFKDSISNEFPHYQVNTAKKIRINIDPSTGNNADRIERESLVWNYSNYDNTKKVELSSKAMTLIYTKDAYSTFESFLKDIELLLNSLMIYQVSEVEFMGLRYINQITLGEYENIQDCINSKFHVNYTQFEGNITQALNMIELKIREYYLKIQYGLFNPIYPTVNSKKDFILDFDCYLKNEEFTNIEHYLKEMHSIIYNEFEESIENKLRKEME